MDRWDVAAAEGEFVVVVVDLEMDVRSCGYVGSDGSFGRDG